MFKAKIYITLKPILLDAQGATIQKALQRLGYGGVERVRMGKYVEVEMEGRDGAQAAQEVEQMCRELLANPVIEDFRFELEEG